MDTVADFIRSQETRICELWRAEVQRDASDAKPVLIDHLPEFLSGLADWIEGNTQQGEQTFALLTASPALQQLGYGVGIETLTREYSKLRVVLVRELLATLSSDEMRDSFVRLQEAMDLAIDEAIRCYATRREEVRDRFISILGHDLRDPLSTAIISARVIASNPHLDREHRLGAARIVRSCNRMQRMVNDVLDFARGHLGNGIPAARRPNDMGEICRAAADEIIAAYPQRTIILDITGELVSELDRDRVHQAITNLLSNAIHHGEDPIVVRAYADRDIVTEVTSHGPPIPQTIREQIFDPFAQGHDTTPREGLGLGLYIVQQIALAHGARCEVESDADGTTFRIRWPHRERRKRAAV